MPVENVGKNGEEPHESLGLDELEVKVKDYTQKGTYSLALRYANEMFYLDETDGRSYLLKAHIYRQLGKPPKVVNVLQNGLRKVPRGSSLWADIKQLLHKTTLESRRFDPADCLPLDIMLIIFSKAIETTDDLTRLMLVSKQWRNLVLSQSSFWTQLHFPARRKFTASKTIEKFMSHSGKAPLSLVVSGKIQRPERLVGYLRKRPNLTSLHLEQPSLRFDEFIKHRTHFSSLENLHIHCENIDLGLAWALETMPQLKCLSLIQLKAIPPYHTFCKIMGPLETLRLKGFDEEESITLDIIEDILSQRKLIELTLDNVLTSIEPLRPMIEETTTLNFTPCGKAGVVVSPPPTN